MRWLETWQRCERNWLSAKRNVFVFHKKERFFRPKPRSCMMNLIVSRPLETCSKLKLIDSTKHSQASINQISRSTSLLFFLWPKRCKIFTLSTLKRTESFSLQLTNLKSKRRLTKLTSTLWWKRKRLSELLTNSSRMKQPRLNKKLKAWETLLYRMINPLSCMLIKIWFWVRDWPS